MSGLGQSQDVPLEVTVSVPCERRFVGTLRGMASSLGSLCDLTVDELEDIQIAVDEACALLIPTVGAAATMHARFRLDAGELWFEICVPAGRSAALDREGLSWMVLSAIADDLQVSDTGGELTLSGSKRRSSVDER